VYDSELDDLKARVDCRTVLERAGWIQDVAQSAKNSAKYRNGIAQIIIVTHEGRGWFDPLNDQRGDVLALAQRVWGGNLGQVRKVLRPLAGDRPVFIPAERERLLVAPLNAPQIWNMQKFLVPGSPAWCYLTEKRKLSAAIVKKANAADLLREGIYGTVWALHRSNGGQPCGWEMRGPRYKGFAKGGEKTLFWLGDLTEARRIVVTESAIDALSRAEIEGCKEETVYVSTGGGFGPPTIEVLRRVIRPGCRIVAATDRGQGGELLAGRLHELAKRAEAGFGRLRPIAKDWNEQLTNAD
jgi:hypothetical protein